MEEAKIIKKVLKELKIQISDVKSINIKWEKVLNDRAFPNIEIVLK